jgi:hypothetical protein
MKGRFYKPAAWANLSVPVLAVHWVRVPCLPNPSARTSPARDGFEKLPKLKLAYRRMFSGENGWKCPSRLVFYLWELLKTYCAGESVSSRVGQIRRHTLGTCPAFANPVTANFTRSRRFLEAPLFYVLRA